MKRTISKIQFFVLIFSILTFLFVAGVVFADTGTYRILDYKVDLTPRSDGTVDIQYYQKWLVTGGNIPWITVGTPNDNFSIVGYGGAAIRITSVGQGGWSGVRLDLDSDYQASQVFEVSFTIAERGLFYADSQNYRLDFTPGWYDRATTDTLRISVKFFAKLETVKASPEPSLTSGEEIVWVKNNLGKGERFSISISFPQKLFPSMTGTINKTNLKESPNAGNIIFTIMVMIVLAIIIIAAVLAPPSRRRPYSGGRIFYGGFFGGGSGKGGGIGGDKSTGGGGGFGGASISCACACVSCACACACAGGGGAGCSRKVGHTCPLCKSRRRS
ncbi:MAG: hypothetical protein MUP41_21045 [Desulfobacterales bacterium]|nr:hypothetical protein [Desulfobacterales bacterium]